MSSCIRRCPMNSTGNQRHCAGLQFNPYLYFRVYISLSLSLSLSLCIHAQSHTHILYIISHTHTYIYHHIQLGKKDDDYPGDTNHLGTFQASRFISPSTALRPAAARSRAPRAPRGGRRCRGRGRGALRIRRCIC